MRLPRWSDLPAAVTQRSLPGAMLTARCRCRSKAGMSVRLSVLMPAKDAESTIVAALRSTLRSMPEDSELLVLDDASSDGTAAAVRRIKDRRIRLEATSTSVGVASALNQLLAISRAEFVARMDADDVSLPGRFVVQMRALGGRDAVFCSTVLFGRGSRTRITPLAPLSSRGSPYALLLGNPFAHSTMFARKQVLKDVSGYRSCLAEDYDLWMRMAAAGSRLARDWTPGVALRQHSAQVTATAGWGDRAAAEPEWQESYEKLMTVALPASAAAEALVAVFSAKNPAAKARAIAPILGDQVRNLPKMDQIAIRLLARREGVRL